MILNAEGHRLDVVLDALGEAAVVARVAGGVVTAVQVLISYSRHIYDSLLTDLEFTFTYADPLHLNCCCYFDW